MAKTVAETINEITRRHLEENNGLLFGQAVTAVGWVNNTVPDCENIVEFPMSDVSNMGVACGAAISGRRPIIVIRFQDFLWLNSSPLVNYAAKSKDILGTPTPILVRALAQESVGCTHSGVLHGVFMHMPGLRISAPMTPFEYKQAWSDFMENDDPMILSEHRVSFCNTEEMPDIVNDDASITIYGISAARFNLKKAAEILLKEGIKCNIVHIVKLKPFKLTSRLLNPLLKSKAAVVVDAGFQLSGAAESIAYSLMLETSLSVKAVGLEDRSVGISEASQNCTPSAEKIALSVRAILNDKVKPAFKKM